MKSSKKILLFLILIWVIFLIGIHIYNKKSIENVKNKLVLSEEFNINEYSMHLNINKNRKIDVNEKFNINIDANSKENIIREIPKFYVEHKNENENKNKNIKKQEILRAKAENQRYEKEENKKSVLLKIGKGRPFNKEVEDISITYRLDLGKDINKGYDEIIYSISKIAGNLSKEFLNKDFNIYLNGLFEINDKNIILIQNGNEILEKNILKENEKINIKIPNKYLKENLNLRIKFEDGYFIEEHNFYGYKAIALSSLILLNLIVSIYIWLKYGRNFNGEIVTAEFYPPLNLDPAQIGYIYKNRDIKKLASTVIISLANKEYINLINYSKNKYIIEKNKKIPEVIENIKENRKNTLTISEKLVYDELFKEKDVNYIYEDESFSEVFPKLKAVLERTIDEKIEDQKSIKYGKVLIGILLTSILIWIVSYFMLNDLRYNLRYIFMISGILAALIGVISLLMNKKSDYGNLIYAKVLGFRDYLITAEKDILDEISEKNPSYFYDILSYAYSLDVSKNWLEKFNKENIKMLDNNLKSIYTNDDFLIL